METPRNMSALENPREGYIPTYTRTDTEIITKKKMKEILKQTKRNISTYFSTLKKHEKSRYVGFLVDFTVKHEGRN